jgi:hypothetical protein
MRKIMILGIIFLVSFLTVDSCFAEQNSSFEVHEWGVFVKGDDCNDTYVLTEPLLSELTLPEKIITKVRKPVIYFHADSYFENILVKVSSINNATVIPNATLENNNITWDIILENNTIKHNNSEYPYLFYEGDIITHPNISAFGQVWDGYNHTNYYVINWGDYPISNVILVHGRMKTLFRDSKFDCIYFGDVNPGEEKKIVNTSLEYILNISETKNKIYEGITTQGLTESESTELLDYWEDWWFNFTNYYEEDWYYMKYGGDYALLIYSIPQAIYDELLPLNITPTPDKIVRVGLFTINDVQISNVISNSTPADDNEKENNGTPGFELILVVLAIALVLFWQRKRI